MIAEIWINCPSVETADTLAKALMDKRLVACANRYPAIASRYVWQGKLAQAEEVPLLLKTRRDLFDAVRRAATDLHPYETPSILCLDVAVANQDYIDWILANTIAPVRYHNGALC